MESSDLRGTAAERPFTTKTDWVYERLRARILDGQHKPDGRLRLTELAQEFQISEMPVREALRMLQRDGLVRMENHRGATVITPSWEHAAEIVSMRMHLEVLAAQEAAGRHSAASIADIERLLRRMDDDAAAGRADAFSQGNREFHRLLYAPGANAALKQEIQDLWDRVWRARAATIFGIDRKRMAQAQTEHRKIFTAIRQGDPTAGKAAMERHRSHTMASWRRIIAQSDEEGIGRGQERRLQSAIRKDATMTGSTKRGN
jgi:DNA-binding GntR family transcriptional regulator